MADLSALRKRVNKTQAQVAAELGFSVSKLNRHERGKQPLNRLERLGYALYYGVDPDEVEQP